jgi:GGDEF domain-containing protein
VSGERAENPDVDPAPAEPSASDVEALVRSIEAKEAATGARPVAANPSANGSTASNGSTPSDAPVPRPPVIVVSTPASAKRPAVPGAPRGLSTTPRRGQGSAIVGLTGRLEWERLVADESERQRRYGRPSAIVLVELSGLDRAITQAGTGVIGRVVPPCAETLVALARASDRVTRLRDGRFGILLRETDADGASRYAARAVASCDPWLAAMPWPLRLVVASASTDGGEDLVSAVRLAERRLQTATAKAEASSRGD